MNFVLLEFPGQRSIAVYTSQDTATVMAAHNCTRAFTGTAYDPATLNHNHLQALRTDYLWALLEETDAGYALINLSHVPIVTPVGPRHVCVQVESVTELVNGAYVTKAIKSE